MPFFSFLATHTDTDAQSVLTLDRRYAQLQLVYVLLLLLPLLPPSAELDYFFSEIIPDQIALHGSTKENLWRFSPPPL